MRTPGPPTGIPGPPEPRSPSAAQRFDSPSSAAPPAPLTGAPGRDDRPFLAAEAARSRAPAGGAAVSGGTSRASRRTNPVRQARPRSADRRPRPQHRPHRGTGPRRSSSPGRRGAGAGSPYPRRRGERGRTPGGLGHMTEPADRRAPPIRAPKSPARRARPRGRGSRAVTARARRRNPCARADRAPGRRQVAAVARGHLAHGRGRPAREVARGGGHSTPMSRTAPCLPPW